MVSAQSKRHKLMMDYVIATMLYTASLFVPALPINPAAIGTSEYVQGKVCAVPSSKSSTDRV